MADKIAVIGAGLIGRAWAITFARAGHPVSLYDSEADALRGSLDSIAGMVADLVSSGLLDASESERLRARIAPAESIEAALAGAAHVQENVPENLEIKRAVFARLDALAPPATVLASSSSAILPSLFTETLAGRRRCLVAHPINPPYLIPAVELVPAPWTDPATVERTRRLMEGAGQSPMVMRREIDGFIMNRLQAALLQEAFRLVGEGYASIEDVDIGIRKGLGLRWAFMGPFETIDLNAPGGVIDYVARYEPALRRLARWPTEQGPWAGPLAKRIEAERTRRLPRERLAERQRWRDRRLMALLRHLRADQTEIGA